jgi:succinate dehydrogenase/fumarate reductase cytochrome b subunit
MKEEGYMGRSPAARAAIIVGSLLLFGIVLRLLVAVLSPVLPGGFMRDLKAGWQMLYGMVAPAIPPIMAVLILGAVCWVVMGWWRRF